MPYEIEETLMLIESALYKNSPVSAYIALQTLRELLKNEFKQ